MQVVQKHVTKENTKPVDFRLHTQQRAVSRAIYNYTVSVHQIFLTRLIMVLDIWFMSII